MDAAALKEYEVHVVEPRHRETQSDLANALAGISEIKGMVSEGRGMMRLAGWIGSIAGIVWIVIQITNAVKH